MAHQPAGQMVHYVIPLAAGDVTRGQQHQRCAVIGRRPPNEAETQLGVHFVMRRHAKAGQIIVPEALVREGLQQPFQRRGGVKFSEAFCR